MQSYSAQYSTRQYQNVQSNPPYQPNGAFQPLAPPPGNPYPHPSVPPQLPPTQPLAPQPIAPCHAMAHAPLVQSAISPREVYSSGGYPPVSSQPFAHAQCPAATPHSLPPFTTALPPKPPSVENQCNVGAAAPVSYTVYNSFNDLPPHLKQAIGQASQQPKIKNKNKLRQPHPIQPLITAPRSAPMPVQVIQPQIKPPVSFVNQPQTQMLRIQPVQASPTVNILPTVSPITTTQIGAGAVLSPPTNPAFIAPIQTPVIGGMTTPMPHLNQPKKQRSTLDTICKVTDITANVLDGIDTLSNLLS